MRNFLIGLKFVIYTDCQDLIYTNAQRSSNSQVARWFCLLQEYDYTVRYRKSENMTYVDALSRTPTLDARCKWYTRITIKDEILAFQIRYQDLV